MNTSERTVAIAKGVFIYSQIQNYPPEMAPGHVKTHWTKYQKQYKTYVPFVKVEQARLFDRVNRFY